MSVLIKGMEMPTRCFACPLCVGEENDWSCAISHGPYIEYRVIETNIAIDTCPDWCPLIPIPSHGRLIDADAYETLIRGLGNREYRRENGTICDAIKFLHPYYTPTIIEAEEVTQKDGGKEDV